MTWSFPRNTTHFREKLGALHVPKRVKDDLSNLLRVSEEPKTGIGIACSGGADSTFLSFLISSEFPQIKSRTHILHFNHKTRGVDSDKDEGFVRKLAEHLNIKFISKATKVSCSLDEASLRDERMKFFLESGRKLQLDYLLVGHHADDVAETMLWRLPRASTLEGIISPRPIVNHKGLIFLRPLLNIGRQQIQDLLQELQIPWREDKSNESKRYLRNRLRMNVVPQWKGCMDQELLSGLSKTRNLLEQDMDAINDYSEIAMKECKQGNKLEVQKFNSFPLAIRRRVLREWLKQMHGESFSFNGRESEILQQIEMKNLTDSDISGGIRITLQNNCINYSKINCIHTTLPIACLPKNQSIFFPYGKMIKLSSICLTDSKRSEILSKTVNPESEAYLDTTDKFFFVRRRQEGDRFQPLGMKDSKKVGQLMTNKKWSNDKKAETPILVNQQGEIVWIPGFPPHDSLKVDSHSDRVIHLTYQ